MFDLQKIYDLVTFIYAPVERVELYCSVKMQQFHFPAGSSPLVVWVSFYSSPFFFSLVIFGNCDRLIEEPLKMPQIKLPHGSISPRYTFSIVTSSPPSPKFGSGM